jgi:hypothetical protein
MVNCQNECCSYGYQQGRLGRPENSFITISEEERVTVAMTWSSNYEGHLDSWNDDAAHGRIRLEQRSSCELRCELDAFCTLQNRITGPVSPSHDFPRLYCLPVTILCVETSACMSKLTVPAGMTCSIQWRWGQTQGGVDRIIDPTVWCT